MAINFILRVMNGLSEYYTKFIMGKLQSPPPTREVTIPSLLRGNYNPLPPQAAEQSTERTSENNLSTRAGIRYVDRDGATLWTNPIQTALRETDQSIGCPRQAAKSDSDKTESYI